MNKISITIILLASSYLGLFAQPKPVTIDKAAKYFEEVKAICDKDNGTLWGINLWSPLLLINHQTRDIIANEQDSNSSFALDGEVYTGKFPENKIIANSTTELNGKKWVMVIVPLPKDAYTRNQLIVHEMFHYLQDTLGLIAKNYNNNHMDEMLARIYLKLEWAALNKAIQADSKKSWKEAIADALVFREYRRMLYPQADSSENRFEMQEGLADYTGHKLCTNSKEELKKKLLAVGKKTWNQDSYVRSFGYYSGFAYAYLLDGGSSWQEGLTPDTNLAELVRQAYSIKLPINIEEAQQKRRDAYGYVEINEYETALQKEKDELFAMNEKKFIHGSTLILPLQKPNIGFNPNNLQAFGDKGTVYPTITAFDAWGKLVVEKGGCLLDNGWKSITLSAENIQINNTEVKGNGWILQLNKGYTVTEVDSGYLLSSAQE